MAYQPLKRLNRLQQIQLQHPQVDLVIVEPAEYHWMFFAIRVEQNVFYPFKSNKTKKIRESF